MEFFDLLLLAVVQGVTEFLPVSSSGHLVILGSLLDDDSMTGHQMAGVTIALHVGTLLSIVVFYFRELIRLVGRDRRQLGLLLLASLPAAAVGIPLKLLHWDERLHDARVASASLIVTGLVLLVGGRASRRQSTATEMSAATAAWIGLAQALAIVPGLSRSGLTITAAIIGGVASREAARFSFLLAIPAIAGAGLLQLMELSSGKAGGSAFDAWQLCVGAAVAAAVGWLSLSGLLLMLGRGRFAWFAVWCLPVGTLMLIRSL
ncbi:MAG: UDP-diphosphatase [Planctomycetaceae bacterium]|jgi:undecaprenyl-diphosphatase|nr:UDP-diphosphatase [Planctomycetaceae bacterium]MDP7274912.1 undecaprenyl-diphosphate phosphatase [Planctomycetaceae bacterium]